MARDEGGIARKSRHGNSRHSIALVGTRMAILLLAAVAIGCGSRPNALRMPTKYKGQIIHITDTTLRLGSTDTIRFGRLHSGEIAVTRLRLTNATNRPIQIHSYVRSCGCTDISYDNQPIAAGQSQQISLSFDSRGESGWQLKTLDLRFSGSSRPLRLFIEADVE